MIRRFVIAQGDNNAVTTRIDIDPTVVNGTQFVESGFPVSWAIITGGGDSATGTTRGPIYFDPDGSITYSVSTISGGDEYAADSLQVFLNGQLLDNGLHFEETVGQDDFDLLVGAGGIESTPVEDDTVGVLTFSGQTAAFNIGATLTQGSTTATIVGVSNDSPTTGQLNLTDISPGGSSFTAAAIADDGTSPGAATAAGTFQQGGDRLAIAYRPKVVTTVDGVEVYISSLYPDSDTGFIITFNGATPGSQFTVDVVYR